MDIRKVMSLCTSCISPNRVCLPLQSTFAPVWSTTTAPVLAEDGGICLADYSPNGESLCALSEVIFSEKSESTPLSSCSYNSMSLSNGSIVSSNESLAEKASSLTMDFTDSGNTNEDIDQLSVDSMISNEAEAIISFSSSLKDSSLSLDRTQSSLLSFAELAEPCGGEGLAEGLSCSSEGDSALNSFSSISSTPTPTTEGSVSPVVPITYVIEEITRL